MLSMRRNQIIITALVVMIAVAGYLNYQDTRNDFEQVSLNDHGEMSSALVPRETDSALTFGTDEFDSVLTMDGLVGRGDGFTEIFTEDQADPGEAVFVNSVSATSYFVQAKLDREQARSRQKELLLSMINDEKLQAEQKASAAEAMLEIQQRIERESAAETLIESRGFNEVYVRISDETVDVVVDKEVLSDAELAQIEDAVRRKTGMDITQIRVSTMRR